jgi:hypothetical protein
VYNVPGKKNNGNPKSVKIGQPNRLINHGAKKAILNGTGIPAHGSLPILKPAHNHLITFSAFA